MKLVSLILAHANGDDVNAAVSPRDGRTPLHLASSLGNLAMAQLLIWVSLIILGLLTLGKLPYLKQLQLTQHFLCHNFKIIESTYWNLSSDFSLSLSKVYLLVL